MFFLSVVVVIATVWDICVYIHLHSRMKNAWMCVPCALKLLCLVLWLHFYIYSPPTMWCTMITSENLIRPHSFRTEFSTICTFNRKPEENSSQMWIMILGKSDGIDKLMKKWKYYYARAIRLHPDHMRATVHCVEWVFWIHCRRICILFLLIDAINIKKIYI